MAKVLKNQSLNLPAAYDLVITDLFKHLCIIRNGGKIKLGNLGTFHKTQRKLKSALNNRTYLYYQISFKASSTLKKELDK